MTLGERMARVRSKDTGPEMVVRRLLHSLGYRYRLHVAKLPGTPDLVFARRRKVIFVHRCFWHQHPGCRYAHLPRANPDYWHRKLKRNSERDAEAEAQLRMDAWDVLTVWECETTNPTALAETLAAYLGETAAGRHSDCEVQKGKGCFSGKKQP